MPMVMAGLLVIAMGQDETDDRQKLLEAARALLARGDAKFSITTLCAEAQVGREIFRTHFAGKAALLAALMEPTQPTTQEPLTDSKAAQEPGVPAPDAWLERRLRVFERALTALEARAEATAQDHARAIADMEDKLLKVGLRQSEARPRTEVPEPMAEVAAMLSDMPEPGPVIAETPVEFVEPMPERPAPELLSLAPAPDVVVSKEEMAGVLQVAREKTRAVPEEKSPDGNSRLRWLAIGGLSLVALFLCIGLTMGNTAGASAPDLEGSGVTHRTLASGALARTVALADSGNGHAQAQLALAYLRGTGVDSDAAAAARWSAAGAQSGSPQAQYLLGALYNQGNGVKADPAKAVELFAAAAARGNLKAMHNLAIAYAQGQGTEKNEAKAAEWFARAAERGYVDSAFDLAVLYERGEGVAQDLKQAMKWYGVAAFAGDQASQARLDFLRTQMKPADVKLAMMAASSFAPLAPLDEANSL